MPGRRSAGNEHPNSPQQIYDTEWPGPNTTDGNDIFTVWLQLRLDRQFEIHSAAFAEHVDGDSFSVLL